MGGLVTLELESVPPTHTTHVWLHVSLNYRVPSYLVTNVSIPRSLLVHTFRPLTTSFQTPPLSAEPHHPNQGLQPAIQKRPPVQPGAPERRRDERHPPRAASPGDDGAGLRGPDGGVAASAGEAVRPDLIPTVKLYHVTLLSSGTMPPDVLWCSLN